MASKEASPEAICIVATKTLQQDNINRKRGNAWTQ